MRAKRGAKKKKEKRNRERGGENEDKGRKRVREMDRLGHAFSELLGLECCDWFMPKTDGQKSLGGEVKACGAPLHHLQFFF